jgi:hypothetical protein
MTEMIKMEPCTGVGVSKSLCIPLPILTHSTTKRYVRATMPKAKLRASAPTRHRAVMNVWIVSIWVCCASVQRTEEPYQKRTRVINAAPTPPICLRIPCAVQYGPVVTIPSWAHRVLRIPPMASRMSYMKRESCDTARIRLCESYGNIERTMYMSVGVRRSFQSPFGRVFL